MDLGFALVCSTLANVNRGKNQKAYTPKDFLFDFEPKKKQSAEQMKRTMESVAKRSQKKKDRTPNPMTRKKKVARKKRRKKRK